MKIKIKRQTVGIARASKENGPPGAFSPTNQERTMPQTLYHASGLTADNADKLKDAGMNVPGVKWVNINNGNVVVTHDDSFDADAFAAALHGTDGSVSLSR